MIQIGATWPQTLGKTDMYLVLMKDRLCLRGGNMAGGSQAGHGRTVPPS